MKTSRRLWLFFIVALWTTALGFGQTTIFNASLTGAQEVPSTGSPGTGSGTLQFDNSTRAWTLSGTFTGLQGTTTGAHIHGAAAVGVSAGVITGISFTSGATNGTFSGSGTFSIAEANDLLAGLYYVNLHTSSFGGGEIRGQLTAIPEPATYAFAAGLVGLVTAASLGTRRRRATPISLQEGS
jgi:hypothetical protein